MISNNLNTQKKRSLNQIMIQESNVKKGDNKNLIEINKNSISVM